MSHASVEAGHPAVCSTVAAVLSVKTARMDSLITDGQTDSMLSVKGLISLSIFISVFFNRCEDNVR